MTDLIQEKNQMYAQYLINCGIDPIDFYTNLKHTSKKENPISNKTFEDNIKLHNLITKINELSSYIINDKLDNIRVYNVLNYILFKLNRTYNYESKFIISHELLNMINNLIYLLYIKSNIDYDLINTLITNTLNDTSFGVSSFGCTSSNNFPINFYKESQNPDIIKVRQESGAYERFPFGANIKEPQNSDNIKVRQESERVPFGYTSSSNFPISKESQNSDNIKVRSESGGFERLPFGASSYSTPDQRGFPLASYQTTKETQTPDQRGFPLAFYQTTKEINTPCLLGGEVAVPDHAAFRFGSINKTESSNSTLSTPKLTTNSAPSQDRMFSFGVPIYPYNAFGGHSCMNSNEKLDKDSQKTDPTMSTSSQIGGFGFGFRGHNPMNSNEKLDKDSQIMEPSITSSIPSHFSECSEYNSKKNKLNEQDELYNKKFKSSI